MVTHDNTPTTLACSQCRAIVRLVGIEIHPDHPDKDLVTFECSNGHVIAINFPE